MVGIPLLWGFRPQTPDPSEPPASKNAPGFHPEARGRYRDSGYWIGATVADAVNGSVGAATVVLCQIVLPAFTANARVPVDPKVCGIAVA